MGPIRGFDPSLDHGADVRAAPSRGVVWQSWRGASFGGPDAVTKALDHTARAAALDAKADALEARLGKTELGARIREQAARERLAAAPRDPERRRAWAAARKAARAAKALEERRVWGDEDGGEP